ncbi:MAG: GNAT family N-acetyltransferase [Acidobacteria bacterium]|nr:GNAT family N-acetyltransferase [Acidobacteriota bacterium]
MITGETVSLRPFERRHLAETRAWANDAELMLLLDRARPVSEVEHEKWFATLDEKKSSLYFAIEVNADGQHIGNIWLWDLDWRHRKAELRIVIGNSKQHNRGAGTEAISLLCYYAFHRLNLHKIYAYVLAVNPRARRSFEKAGFSLEGTLREDRWVEESYTDVFLLGKLR